MLLKFHSLYKLSCIKQRYFPAGMESIGGGWHSLSGNSSQISKNLLDFPFY